jgi:hypothetical protein
MKCAEDCKLLQSDINSIQKWSINNYVKHNIFKTNMFSFTRKIIISFTLKTNNTHFSYFFGDLLTDCVKGLGVMLDCKLSFFVLHSQALLGLICCFIYHISSLGSLQVLCITLIHSKLEYAFVIWNMIILADSNKL